jgi:hypothetical protein
VAQIRHGAECTDEGAMVHAWLELPGVDRRRALSAWTEPGLVRDWWGGELDATLELGGDYVVRFPALDQERADAVGTQEGWEHFLPRFGSSLARTP